MTVFTAIVNNMYFITSKPHMHGKYAASKFGFSPIAHYDNKLHRTGSGRSKLLKLLDRVGPFFGWTVRSLVISVLKTASGYVVS